MNYWLMKSEPDVFSIDDLANRPTQTEPWDGVRNYQARNMMRDDMQVGDQIFFYHSNCAEPGIVGIAEVVKEGYPDHTARNPDGKYFDIKATEENPRWYMVDIKFLSKFKRTISLRQLKDMPELAAMPLVRKGNRLSVMPIDKPFWEIINSLV
jgi:predicted RNA-binding protein with PUA-like domain